MVRFSVIALFILGSFWGGSVCLAETVRIVAEDDWYPYSAKTDTGAEGIAVDIVRAVFRSEGVDVAFDLKNYDQGMEMVKDGQVVGCFNAPRTKEIEDVYLWHDKAMFPAESSFYAISDFQGQVKDLQDVAGKKVGLTQGYGYGNAVDMDQGMLKEYSINDKTLVRKLMAKRLDFIVLFDKIADYLIPMETVSGRIKQVGKADLINIYVAFSKVHPDGKKYRDIFSRGFARIELDGTYDKIMADWAVRLGAAK